jgi:signal transduction histidine kinase
VRLPIRIRVTIVAAVAVLVVLGLTGLALVTAQRVVLTDSVDEVLERQTASISNLIDTGLLPAELPPQGDEESFARVREGGGLVAATAFMPPSEGGYRVLKTSHGDFVIETGTPLDDVDESVATLGRALAIAVPAVSLALALLIWLLVGRVLAPVERIRRQVAAITGSSLDRRVPVPVGSDEIAQLAGTMNEMLDRLERASLRQKRFMADASHELRTPLTRIRADVEVDLAHPDTANLVATHRSVLHEAETLELLIDDLLVLARSDERPDSRAGFALVDLDDLVTTELSRLRGSTALTATAGEVSGAQVLGDSEQLTRVVRNVLDNAARHGATKVAVSLIEDGQYAVLSISDNGDGIPPEFHRSVFDRFVRVDEARSTVNGGTGLGLAIAKEIVVAHSGTIEIDSEYTSGARFVIRIPRPDTGSSEVTSE